MATYYSNFYTSADGSTYRPKYSLTTPFIYGVYEIGTALSGADIVTMLRVPANYTVLGGWLMGDDLDTGTETLELDVGISGDATKFLNSGVISGDAVAGFKPETGILLPLFGGGSDIPWTPTSDTDVIVTVTAAANAGGTGTLGLTVYGCYKYPDL